MSQPSNSKLWYLFHKFGDVQIKQLGGQNGFALALCWTFVVGFSLGVFKLLLPLVVGSEGVAT